MGRSFKSKFLLAPHNHTHHNYRILKLRRYVETSLYSCMSEYYYVTMNYHMRT